MNKASIVILIPEQTLRESISQHLSKQDYQLFVAHDAVDAMTLIETNYPEIAILWNEQIIHPSHIETLDEGNIPIHHYCDEHIIGKLWVASEIETGIFDLAWMSDLDDVYKSPYYMEVLSLQLDYLLEAVKRWRKWHQTIGSSS